MPYCQIKHIQICLYFNTLYMYIFITVHMKLVDFTVLRNRLLKVGPFLVCVQLYNS